MTAISTDAINNISDIFLSPEIRKHNSSSLKNHISHKTTM